jgi:hypothetical protein
MNRNLLPFIVSGLILLLAVLLLIPTTSQALFALVGIDTAGSASIGGFDAFIPFIPGYFPENFTITTASVGSREEPGWVEYTELYASETHFFKTIQRQGSELPTEIASPDLSIQASPASLTHPENLQELAGDDLDLTQYDTSEVWLLTVVMRGIQVQVLSNLPQAEVIRFAEELIPQRCTATPTPE